MLLAPACSWLPGLGRPLQAGRSASWVRTGQDTWKYRAIATTRTLHKQQNCGPRIRGCCVAAAQRCNAALLPQRCKLLLLPLFPLAAHMLALAHAPPPPFSLTPLQVYKLYGGPHGFMISTGVAETDEDHASTLLRFSLHVLQAMHQVGGACRADGEAAAAAACAAVALMRLLVLLLLLHWTSVCLRCSYACPRLRARTCHPLANCPRCFRPCCRLSQQIRLPGPAPVDLCMVLASGRAASGLLGTTSLTYQVCALQRGSFKQLASILCG